MYFKCLLIKLMNGIIPVVELGVVKGGRCLSTIVQLKLFCLEFYMLYAFLYAFYIICGEKGGVCIWHSACFF